MLLVLFLLFSSTYLCGQERIQYDISNGLPSNHVYDIQQDDDGFMWFATNRGIAKYDGNDFKIFTIADGLPTNDIYLLEVDHKNRIWFFCKSIYQGYILNDRIHLLKSENNEVMSPSNIHLDDNGYTLVSNSGFYTFDDTSLIRKSSKFKEIEAHDFVNQHRLKINDYHNQKFDNISYYNFANEMFVALTNDEFFVFDAAYNMLSRIPIHKTAEKSFTTKIYQRNVGFSSKEFVCFTLKEGVVFINFDRNVARYYSYEEDIGRSPEASIKFVFKQGEVQLSYDGLLLIFDDVFNLLEIIDLPNGKFGHFGFKDDVNNYWIASMDGGVLFDSSINRNVNYYFKNEKVQSLASINDKLYVGVFKNGLYSFNTSTNKFEKHEYFSGASFKKIKKCPLSSKGYFLAGEQSYFLRNDTFEKIELNFKGNIESRIVEYKDFICHDSLEYGVTASGLIRCVRNKDTAELLVEKQGLTSIVRLDDDLFLGGSEGLYQLKNNNLVCFDNGNKLKRIPVVCMTQKDGMVWIGTEGKGIFSFDKQKIVHLRNTNGLIVQDIFIENAFLWLATDKGVKKVRIDNNNIQNSEILNSFNLSDGLIMNNVNAVFKMQEQLYVATDQGISVLNLNNYFPLRNVAEKVLYFKNIGDSLHIKRKDLISANFELDIGIIDFSNQEQYKFEYRLNGSNTWSSVLNRKINLSGLKAGTYQLELKAIDQHSNTSTKNLWIQVIPFWYTTEWAISLFGLMSIFLFFIAFKFYEKQIILREKRKSVQEKLFANLEMKALRSQMNPHFVHNSLNSIQYYIQRNEVEISEEYLAKFSTLIRLFFDYSRRQEIKVQDEITLLNYYLQIEQMRFEDKLNYMFEVDPNMDTKEQTIPSLLLQPIVENAVNHGVFHKNECGYVCVKFIHITKNDFKVIILDDGIGINKSLEISEMRGGEKSSNVIKERILLYNQSTDWNIVHSITDVSTIGGSQGTKVELQFTKY